MALYIAPASKSEGYWGPLTSTLDWCEINYQFTTYVAEFANTFSNILTIFLAGFGWWHAIKQGLPYRYRANFFGFALVGIGSFAFHGTLLYEAQLLDELPMIYAASLSCYGLFETVPGVQDSGRRIWLAFLILAGDAAFTAIYYANRNPVFHQAIFAALMGLIVWRTTYLLHFSPYASRPGSPGRTPSPTPFSVLHEKTENDTNGYGAIDRGRKDEGVRALSQEVSGQISRLFRVGAGLFATGFLIWNIDNIFCEQLTNWKTAIGWPAAFLLEGHSWWHLLTAIGTYLMIVGNSYLTLCIKDGQEVFVVDYSLWVIPYVRRTSSKET